MTSPTLSYRCVVCDTAYPEIANEQATLDPRVAIGYCLECSCTQHFRVDVTNAPVRGVPLGDVVDSETDTRPGNVYNGPGAPISGPTPEHLTPRQRAVLAVLADGAWHPGHELTAPDVGGSEGLRRVRELRARGARIEIERKRPDRYTRYYRLVEPWP